MPEYIALELKSRQTWTLNRGNKTTMCSARQEDKCGHHDKNCNKFYTLW
jgi:hypothetical protein